MSRRGFQRRLIHTMLEKMKKILVIYWGLEPEMTEAEFLKWIEQMPELNLIADFETKYFPQKNFFPKEGKSLAFEIFTRYKNYDGFVVLCGFDFLISCSNLLSFSLQNLGKPIVCTANNFFNAKKTQSQENYQLKANLINAVQFSCFDIPEVCLIVDSRVLRATQSQYVVHANSVTLDAPENAILGKIDFSIRLYEKNIIKRNGELHFFENFNQHLILIKHYPFFSYSSLERQKGNISGLFIDFSHYHVLSENVDTFLSSQNYEIPIFLFFPGQKKDFGKENICFLQKMTFDSVIAKIVWAIGQKFNMGELQKIMQKNISGEIIS